MCYWLEERDKAWKYARTHSTLFTRFLFCFISFSFVSFHPFPHLPPYCEASFMFCFHQGGQGEAERSISCLTTERSLFQNQQRKYCVSFWIIKPSSFFFVFPPPPTKNVLQNPTIAKEISHSLHALSRHKLVPRTQQKLLFPCVEDALIACQ